MCAVKPEAGQEPWHDALTLSNKTNLLEFAAIIVFLLKFKVCYLPDYALSYLDIETSAEIKDLYQD